MKRFAFTMIELVFVIVVLGILAAIAVPKFAATRDDAQIAKGRSDVAAIRSAIVSERQARLLRGDSAYINQLHHTTTELFDHNGTTTSTLLQYGLATQNSSNGHWNASVTQMGTTWRYVFHVMNTDINFDYNSTTGTFSCDRTATGNAGTYCQNLID
ncbi:MAG: prepilin-type N-terminal cleavage/methylation domain-containing protein [Sulfuricurvum sp.]|uniref:type II secretion system protein n=1 Tax=Sulfuricurvum sp. TaxID=2025608 RepID=UPI0025FC6328|nr:prepilin-type N-terminal cleavage/methylation domain-containing protein [Sulfuricurvum sp.]MBV5321692.1 prepilin-type N-terminal cleavage/methylation domain-containing protein [Sulfuricurvum sp.]